MKVMIIHHYGGVGGGLTSCLDIARIMQDLNNEVTVAIPSPSNDVKKMFLNEGIEINCDVPEVPTINYHSACSGLMIAWMKYLISRNKINEWYNYLKETEYDMIVLNSVVQVPLIPMVKKLRKKCLLFIRETIKGSVEYGMNPKMKKLMVQADGVVFLTKYDKNSWKIKDSIKQYVIPDIVDKKKFINSNQDVDATIDKRDIVYLYMGGLSYVKGARDLLEAFRNMIHMQNEAKLIILGDTYDSYKNLDCFRKLIRRKDIKYVESCNRIIEHLNKDKERIVLVGLTTNPGEWYLKSDVVIFPVKKVHQARPVYEAGYYRKAVIIPDYKNFEDAVINNYNGCYYKKNDVESLTTTMIKLKNDKVLREWLAKNNRYMYECGHTYEYAKNCMRDILNEV